MGSKLIGTPWMILWLSVVQGMLVVPYVLYRTPSLSLTQAVTQGFKWYTVAGVLGLIILTSVMFSITKIGALNMFVLIILGQLMASTLIDQFGLFGSPTIPVKPMRIVSLAIIAFGVFLLLRSGADT